MFGKSFLSSDYGNMNLKFPNIFIINFAWILEIPGINCHIQGKVGGSNFISSFYDICIEIEVTYVKFTCRRLNVHVWVFGHVFGSLGSSPRGGTAGSYGESMSDLLRNCQPVFQRACGVLHSHQQCSRVPISARSYNTLSSAGSLLGGCEVESGGFDPHFPNDCDVQHLPICSSAYWPFRYLRRKVCWNLLPIFKLDYLFIFWVLKVLYIS